MQARRKKQRNVTKLIFCVIITTIIATILSLSKYQITKADSDSTSVASPIIDISSNIINVSISPEDNLKEYEFSVQNYDEENNINSEVTMEYVLQIKNLTNLPLEFKLYSYNDTTEEYDTENLLNSNTTNSIKIAVGDNITHKYKLQIIWREGENSYLYSGETDYVQIILDSKQAD